MLLWASPWPLPKYCCVVPLETRSSSAERPTEASWSGLPNLQRSCTYQLSMADTPGPCPRPREKALRQQACCPQTFSRSHPANYHGGNTGGRS